MPDPFSPPDFVGVADSILSAERGDDAAAQEWNRIADARARTAISRAYYAIFLRFKEHLRGKRVGWKFPEKAPHTILLLSVGRVLGQGSQLTLGLRRLLDQRGDSDYDLGVSKNVRTAGRLVDEAEDLIPLVDELPEETLAELAFEMQQQEKRLKEQHAR